MNTEHKAATEALWAAMEACSAVEGEMFRESQDSRVPFVVSREYAASGKGAAMCRRRIEELLVKMRQPVKPQGKRRGAA